MKKYLSTILISLFGLSSFADDVNWKLHPIFDEEVSHVVETPRYVYFTSRNMIENTRTETYFSLFRYDKNGEELLPLSATNLLNSNSIKDVVYNPGKGYLLVLYKDYDIDLLKNDGSVINIPFYKQANVSASKQVNNIAIDPDNDRIYLATEFGYVAINDKKNEIAESRIYNTPFSSFSRLGDSYIAIKENDLISAPVSSPRLSINDYTTVATLNSPEALYPVGKDFCILITNEGNTKSIKKVTPTSSGFKIEDIFSAKINNIENTNNGLTIATPDVLYQVKADGSISNLQRPENFKDMAATSDNMSEVWNGYKRKGLNSIKKSGDTWSITRDWMKPDGPATYATTSFANHPNKGLILLDYGTNDVTSSLNSSKVFQISGYKQGRWTNYSPAYTNPERENLLLLTNGLEVDKNNPNYVYITSYRRGMARLNLNDPKDIIHISHSKDPDISNDGFVELPWYPSSNIGYTNISAPHFDKSGNLWMAFPNWDQETPHPHFYVWLAADLNATSSASNIKLPKYVEFDVETAYSNYLMSLPLQKTGNGLIVHSAGVPDEVIILIDTNGTPTDTSDDKYYKFSEYTDSDGNTIEMGRVRFIWEDPSTGYVWICHANGVCYFSPAQVRNGVFQMNRVKVPRNDGTNLADYLLENIAVNGLTADNDGRKWFATAGAGIVCTSSDGREILEEFNSSNSPLPDDVVYGVGYNQENNSLMISTDQGYAEYFLPVSQAASTKTDIKAYPNPVRPDYSGYVTITDIPTGSFVKITDIAGNLVKDLGIMSGFEMLWDLSDSNFNRVKSGVYHIMISPSDESSSYSTVGKLLVMN